MGRQRALERPLFARRVGHADADAVDVGPQPLGGDGAVGVGPEARVRSVRRLEEVAVGVGVGGRRQREVELPAVVEEVEHAAGAARRREPAQALVRRRVLDGDAVALQGRGEAAPCGGEALLGKNAGHDDIAVADETCDLRLRENPPSRCQWRQRVEAQRRLPLVRRQPLLRLPLVLLMLLRAHGPRAPHAVAAPGRVRRRAAHAVVRREVHEERERDAAPLRARRRDPMSYYGRAGRERRDAVGRVDQQAVRWRRAPAAPLALELEAAARAGVEGHERQHADVRVCGNERAAFWCVGEAIAVHC